MREQPPGVSELLEAASRSNVPPIPPRFPSLSTLKSLSASSTANKFLESIESRVSTILKSSDPHKELGQHLLYAFLVHQPAIIENCVPLPSLQAAIAQFFATGEGVLREVDDLRHENAALLQHLSVIEQALTHTGINPRKFDRSVPKVVNDFKFDEDSADL